MSRSLKDMQVLVDRYPILLCNYLQQFKLKKIKNKHARGKNKHLNFNTSTEALENNHIELDQH